MKETKIIAYKGFDENLCCKGFQYEVGKEYVLDGEIECCVNGFHACVNPFEVLEYYIINSKNRYCVVEQSGIIKSYELFSKQVSSKIKILAEIGLDGLFKAGLEWIKRETNPDTIIKSTKDKGKDDSGSYAQIGSSGNHDQISSSGDYAQIGSSGDYAQIGSSGDYTKIGSNGDYARIGSSGFFAQIGSSGECAHIGSSGFRDQIGSSGECAMIASSGYESRIVSSGNRAHIVSSGTDAKIGSIGNSAMIASSSNNTLIESTGEDSVICCAGGGSMVKAKKGSWITLSEWKYSEEKKRDIPVCVKTEYVDGERIKGSTWYKLVDGEFKEQ